MTIDEAITMIKALIGTYITCHGEEDTIAVPLDNIDIEAFDMAIKALEQEPILDKLRAEIKEKAFTEEIFDEDIFNSTNTESVSRETAECESYVETEVVRLSDILEILDRLIAESEG